MCVCGGVYVCVCVCVYVCRGWVYEGGVGVSKWRAVLQNAIYSMLPSSFLKCKFLFYCIAIFPCGIKSSVSGLLIL